MTIDLVDSIESPQTTGSPIPPAVLKASALGAYIAGNSWRTYIPYAQARPDLLAAGRIVTIALNLTRARCGDFEPGGLLNSQAKAFYDISDKTRGLPWMYTFASNVESLIHILATSHVPRSAYYIWSAHPAGGRHICGPDAYGPGRGCGYPKADGTQYGTLPGNCDISVCNDYMFPATPPPPPLPESAMTIAVAPNQDGRLECFVELASGEVKHIKQDTTPLGWWEKSDGSPNWLSLGNPSK